jgi:replicative DNA helicase
MGTNLKIKSKNLEMLILQCSVSNLSFFMKIKNYLDTSDNRSKSYCDDEKYQMIFNLYCRFFDKHKKQPKIKTFKLLVEAYCNKTKQTEETSLYLNNLAEQMYSPVEEEVDLEEIEEQTINFIKENRVYESMMSAQQDMQEGNYEKIVTKMEDAVRVSFDKDLGLSIQNADEVIYRLDDELNSSRVISTGYSNLDNFMEGGFFPKALYCIAGTPGVGKSLILGNFAINAYLQGYKVLVYTLEMSNVRLFSRIFSNLINYSNKEILLDQDGTKTKINNVINQTNGDLIVKEYNANSVSSNDLLAHINDLSMYKGWKPDFIVVDYLLIMSTNDKKRSSDDSYRYFKVVSEELRNIAKILEVPVVTASQINREGMSDRGGTKSVITAKDISESRGILDTVDFFCSIIQTNKHRQDSKLQLHNNKNRNGSTEWRVEYDISYEHMKMKEGAIISQ